MLGRRSRAEQGVSEPQVLHPAADRSCWGNGGRAMTEAQWLTCEDYLDLLRRLRSHTGNRKWRLASFACLQLLPADLRASEIAEAIAFAERVAESGVMPVEAEPFLQELLRFESEYCMELSTRTVRRRIALTILRSVGLCGENTRPGWIIDSVSCRLDNCERHRNTRWSAGSLWMSSRHLTTLLVPKPAASSATSSATRSARRSSTIAGALTPR